MTIYEFNGRNINFFSVFMCIFMLKVFYVFIRGYLYGRVRGICAFPWEKDITAIIK